MSHSSASLLTEFFLVGSPLTTGIFSEHPSIVKELIALGAYPDGLIIRKGLSALKYRHESPLCLAVDLNCRDIVTVLLDGGASWAIACDVSRFLSDGPVP